MNKKFISSLAALVAGANLAVAQQTLPPAGPPVVDSSKSLPAGPVAVAAQPATTYGAQAPPGEGFSGGCAGGGCGPTYQVYGSADYVLWWLRSTNLPPLVGAIPTSLANSMGTLPSGAINPIFGGQSDGTGAHSGLRLTLGAWLDPDQRVGIEASGFDLEHRSSGLNLSSGGAPIIGPLFMGATDGNETIIPVAVPGERTGAVEVGLSDRLWGAEANLRFKTVTVFSDANNVFVGIRTLQFDEGLAIASATTSDDPAHFGFTSFDSFGTHNQFYGVQAGMTSDFRWGGWFLNATEKLALGDVHEVVNIEGVSQQFVGGQLLATKAGGVLALPSNIGHYSRDRFEAVPEIMLNLGYQFGEHVRVYVGYDFLYMSNVVRPGDQIDSVDGRQIPNLSTYDPTAKATRPAFGFNETALWVQGVNFGLEFRY